MENRIFIRPVSEKDFDFILKTNLDNVEVLSPMDKTKMLKMLAMTELFLVAEFNNEPAAFLMAFREGANDYQSENYKWFCARYDKFLYVDRIAIAEPFRSKGIGKKLYHAVFEHARQTKVKYVTCEIDTIPYNAISLNFHKQLGFHEVGTQFVNLNSVTVSLQEAIID